MKKTKISQLLLGVVLSLSLLGCTKPRDNSIHPSLDYQVKIIDGCSYIEVYSGSGSGTVYSLTHKGDCHNPVHRLDKSEKSVNIIP